MSAATQAPTVFLPHGGGPWPVLPLPMMDAAEGEALAMGLRSISCLPPSPPTCLLLISAHWEEKEFTVHTGGAPGMLYDYGGFPEEAYHLKWPAKGAPRQGEQAAELLRDAGFAVAVEGERGYDHGSFIPMMIAYPAAQIPVLQISLKQGLDPAEHLAMGRALAPVREEGAFILGSGNSYHNLHRFFAGDAAARAESEAFDEWLNAAICADPPERDRLLCEWERAPAARACHPRAEHLLPLMVVAGAAGSDQGRVLWEGRMAGMKLSAHAFG